MSGNAAFLLKSIRLQFSYKPKTLGLLFLLTLFLGVNQGFSIVMLIPFLQLIEGTSQALPGGIAGKFREFTDATGIQMSIEFILSCFAFILLLNAALTYFRTLLQSQYQDSFSRELRNRLYQKIILSDWSLLSQNSKHNHIQILTAEVPKLTRYYYFFLQLYIKVILILAHLFFAFMLSPAFTGLVLVFGIISFAFMRRMIKKSFHLGKDQLQNYTQLLKFTDDFWQTVKIAKVHHSERFYFEKFRKANSEMHNLNYSLVKNSTGPQLWYTVAAVLFLILIVYSGYQIWQIPLASFFILILLFSRMMPQFLAVNSSLNEIFSNMASAKMVIDLDEKLHEHPLDNSKDKGEISLQKELRFNNLCFAYDKNNPLFSNFNESIPAYSLTVIFGSSGKGKTTLMDLIAGLQKPDSGFISIDGQIPDDEKFSKWKFSIGYLPQDSFFVDGTLRENLVWDSNESITDQQIIEVLEKVNASQLVKRYPNGLNEFIVNYTFSFSGGERQRLALARVLLRNPRLLLLDEATSSLDSENEQQILNVISKLKEKVTIILITHRESVLPWCDHIIRI